MKQAVRFLIVLIVTGAVAHMVRPQIERAFRLPGTTHYYVTGHRLVEKSQAYQRFMDTENYNGKDVFEAGDFVGYTSAIYEEMQTSLKVPPGTQVDRTRIARIVSKYLADHPKEWRKEGRDLVLAALRGAWPR